MRLNGIGLHSGARVSMGLLPAPPQSGVRFRRVDLEGKPEIEAHLDNVVETTRSTTLGKGNVRVHTVEHVLAALAGSGVDNAVVELDASEPPVIDGSAREFTRLIAAAGVVPQGGERDVYAVIEPMEMSSGETFMAVFPHDRLKLTCTSSDRQGRHTQCRSVELSPETWTRDIAPARTFCFFEEIEYLIKHGLIKGGGLENAVVIRDDAVLTTEPLRFADEFVRHKILDIVGDLSLIGRPVAGHVIAVRPSHAANCELARLISTQMRKTQAAAQAFAPPALPRETAPASGGSAPAPLADGATLEIDDLLKMLPHRYPFLMVDRVTRIEGNQITGVKNVTVNEPFFAGHFPGHPIMPGVLQLEAIAQVAGILMLRRAEHSRKLAYFMSAEVVKWRRPVRPGDTLIIQVELTKWRGKVGKAKGACLVGNDVVSEAEVTFMLVDA